MDNTNNISAAKDIADACWTCKPLSAYVKIAGDFSEKLGETLQEPMFIFFASLCGLWIVISGFKLLLKMTNRDDLIKDVVYITIAGVLLGSTGQSVISYVYTAAIEIMGASSGMIFSLAVKAQANEYTGLVSLAYNGEKAVVKVFQAALAIAGAGDWYDLPKYIYAVVLVLPFFLLIVSYSCQVVVSIFRATMIGVFAPFLFMAFAFGWGRDMAKAGAKTLLASVLVLFASTAALSMTIYGITNGVAVDPTSLTGDDLNEFASITNPQFLVILFLGWAGTALMTEGTSIANSISQTALTNAAAGVMTSVVAVAAYMATKKARMAASVVGGIGGRNLTGGMAATGGQNTEAPKALVDRFKNINKPGGGA